MIADPLTKKINYDFLRGVCSKGCWALNAKGVDRINLAERTSSSKWEGSLGELVLLQHGRLEPRSPNKKDAVAFQESDVESEEENEDHSFLGCNPSGWVAMAIGWVHMAIGWVHMAIG